MGDGRTEVVLLWGARAMSEQNLLVSAGSAPTGSAPTGSAPTGSAPTGSAPAPTISTLSLRPD
jgi:hypothetical protein